MWENRHLLEVRDGGAVRRSWPVAVVAALLAALVLATPAGAASAPPSDDPFYDQPANLASAKPGEILRKRDVDVALGGSPATFGATQVLYRTINQIGQPSATVATIIRPPVPAGGTRLLSYQTAYDGVADTCRPSYALQPGNSGGNAIVTAESGLIGTYLAQGYTVVTSDYQGPSDDFGAGREEGQGTLDAIRAAETQLGATPGSTQTGLVGYSGGSIASMWAAQLAPGYAPELKIVGVAAGGIPPDFAHNLDYIAGSPDWAGAIPAVGIGLARGSRLDLGKMLSERGREVAAEVQKGCLNPAGFPGLTLEDMLKPEYKDWQKVPALVKVFNESIMGRDATPKVPLLMAVGNDDGTGDSVMIAKDVQQLAHTYCDRGLPVQFQELTGMDHTAAFAGFAPLAITFLQSRFADAAPTSGCPIAEGNPLTPLKRPSGAAELTSGVLLEGLKSKRRKPSVLVRATASDLQDVRIEVKSKRKGKRAKTASTAVEGVVGYDGVRVPLPVRKLKPKAKYEIVAHARLQTAEVETTLKVKSKKKRKKGH